MTQALKVEVTAERGALVFVDPDGDRHVCRSPEEAWELLEDLSMQVQEQGGALVAAEKPEPKRRRSRRQEVLEQRAAEKAQAGGGKAGLARVEVGAVAHKRPAAEPTPVTELTDDQPQEEFGAWERGVASLAHAAIKKGGEISSTSRFGRGGRFGRPKGT